MQRPEFAIVIPVRNGARYLAETLASVFAQRFGDFEVIVTDDGSTDDSVAIAQGFSDPRLRILTHPPLGIAGNWNHGLDRARAPWLKVLPQDDLLHPDALARARCLLRRTRDPVFYFSRRRVIYDAHDAWSREWVRHYACLDEALQPLDRVNAGPVLVRRWARRGLRENRVGEPVATLLPTALARSLGGFSEGLQQDLDYALWMRLMVRGDVCFEPEPLCSYRLHAESATRRNQQEARLEREHVGLLTALAGDRAVLKVVPQLRRLLWAERARRLKQQLLRGVARQPLADRSTWVGP
jgi:glycosyltransferase involved in cell wall biosynthesis